MAEIIIDSVSTDLQLFKQQTEDGTEYEIGQPKGSGNEIRAQGHGSPFSLEVNWVPGEGWKSTDSKFAAKTGILRYQIVVDAGEVYYYKLEFYTTQSYNYTFSDKTGQGYGNNVFIPNKDHTISYNSRDATIVRVSGE